MLARVWQLLLVVLSHVFFTLANIPLLIATCVGVGRANHIRGGENRAGNDLLFVPKKLKSPSS